MSALSQPPLERARKAHGAVLRAMEEPGTARNVAQVLGVAESTVSRTKKDSLEDAIVLLYHLGFKVVGQDVHCYPEEYMRSLHTLAKMQMDSGPKLEWE